LSTSRERLSPGHNELSSLNHPSFSTFIVSHLKKYRKITMGMKGEEITHWDFLGSKKMKISRKWSEQCTYYEKLGFDTIIGTESS